MKYEFATQAECAAVFSGTTASAAIDVSGCLGIIIAYGGTGEVEVSECDTSDGSFTDVASSDLVEGSGTIGYKGYKRYIKVTGSAGTVSGAVVKIDCTHAPTA